MNRPQRSLSGLLSQSSPLYYECASLRSDLLLLDGFAAYFQLADSVYGQSSADPVTQLWEVFLLGIPLCHLFNLLPHDKYPKVPVPPGHFDPRDLTGKHESLRALAWFSMQARRAFLNREPQFEPFVLSELVNKQSVQGLQKVIKIVKIIMQKIPGLGTSLTLTGGIPSPLASSPRRSSAMRWSSDPLVLQQRLWDSHVSDLVTKERHYVHNLDTLQQCATILKEKRLMDRSTVNLVFPKSFFLFQRKFCIRLECISLLSWHDQRWGRVFLDSANDLAGLYRIYCVNRDFANFESVYSSFDFQNPTEAFGKLLYLPEQRLLQYTQFLEALIGIAEKVDHTHCADLLTASESIREVINQLHSANIQTQTEKVKQMLISKIGNWKSVDPDHLGMYFLSEVLNVVRKEERIHDAQLFLFERGILCCEETISSPTISLRRRKPSISSPPTWTLVEYISIASIAHITKLSRSEVESPELLIVGRTASLKLVFSYRDQLDRWLVEIESLRLRSEGKWPKSIVIAPPLGSDVSSDSELSPTTTLVSRNGLGDVGNSKLFVKAHFKGHVFTIAVEVPIEYGTLIERISSKIRSCGYGEEDEAFAVQVKQASGLMVALTQEAFVALEHERTLHLVVSTPGTESSDSEMMISPTSTSTSSLSAPYSPITSVSTPKLFIKAHYKGNIFTIVVSLPVTYDTTLERIKSKIRACGGGSDVARVNVKLEGVLVELTRDYFERIQVAGGGSLMVFLS